VATEERPLSGGEGFAPVDHTADIALRVWAADLAGLFRQAARGLAGLLTDLRAVTPREEQQLQLEGLDLEELLVSWLGELLYRFESRGFLLPECRALRIEPHGTGVRLTATLAGERRDPARHPPGKAIKAATYHRLQIAPGPSGAYEVTIVFDT
jgi:SHS2 domain-containing protein